jgi:hypothetical protein
MKKILFTLSFLIGCINAMYSTAVVCHEGNCMEVTMLKYQGENWQNACCENIPFIGNCEDDCKMPGILLAPPSTYLTAPHFTLPGGNNTWVVENGTIVPEPLNEASSAYQFLEAFSFNFFNLDSNLDFVTVTLDSNKFAIVGRGMAYDYGRKSSKLQEATLNWELYPNPLKSNRRVWIETDAAIRTIELVDLNGKILQTQRSSLSTAGKQSLELTSNLSKGIYFVRLYRLDNSTVLKKLVILE